MDTKNISGKNHLYIDDARKSQAIAYNVDGATEQQTYTGKNLFNPSNTQTSNGITSTKNIDGSLSYSGTASAVWCDLTSVIPLSIPSGTTLTFSIDSPKEYRVVIYFDTSNTDRMIIPIGDTSVTLTTTTAHTQVKINFDRLTTNTSYSGKIYPQLEQGSTSTDYEPYVGGTASPNPDYPQEVKTIPSIINLYESSFRKSDGTMVINAGVGTEENGIYSLTATSSDLFIWQVQNAGNNYNENVGKLYKFDNFDYTLTITNKLFTKNYITYYDENKTSLGYTRFDAHSFRFSKNDKPGAKYFAIRIGYSSATSGTTYNFSIMLEKGSIAHKYIPYGYYSRIKVTGKNMLDISKILSGTYYGVPITCDNTFNLNGTTSSAGYIMPRTNTEVVLPAGTYKINAFIIDGSIALNGHGMNISIRNTTDVLASLSITQLISGIDVSQTITLNEKTPIYIESYVNSSGIVFNNTKIGIQIEEGSTATTYEPYKENQVLIDMSKENLLNMDELDFYNAYYNDSGNVVESANDGMVQYIDAEPNTFYTLTKDVSTRNIWIVEFDESKTFIKRTARYDTNVADNFVLTVFTNSATKYLAIFGNYNNQPVTKDIMKTWNMRLYRSNNPTPYHELCKINTYKDILSIDDQGNCIINKLIGKVVLNGNESWEKQWTEKYGYRTSVNNILQITSASQNSLLYSNYFVSYSPNDLFRPDVPFYGICQRANQSQIIIRNDDQTTINDLKTWLSTHNTDVYYVLDTPETITLKNTPLPLFSGTNHITFVDDLETDTTLVYENDISPSDKQALIDGSATIQTEIVVHNENLLNLDDGTYSNNGVTAVVKNGKIILNGTAGSGNSFINIPCESITLTANQTYVLSANNSETIGTASDPYACLRLRTNQAGGDDTNTDTRFNILESKKSITKNTDSSYEILRIRTGETLTYNNFIIQPMLEEGTPVSLTETNSVIDWNHEDFRQVKDEGFIGQFVARQITGNLHNLDDDFSITDKELELKLGVRTNNNTNWYSLGNFLTTKVSDDEVGDKTNFEALDYTKKFNKEYEDRVIYPCTALTLAKDVCDQCGVELGNFDFKNNDYVIDGNYFTNNESCRDVMKAIGKLAFSWVRCDWDNKVYIDFNPTPFITNQIPETCDTIGNNKYYNLKTQKEVYGPVDKVVIGYSAIEGERTYIGNENGTCVINVFDNPLVYNQEQRAAVIEAAYSLLGLTYTPLNTQTIGHPWLRADEPVKINDMESVSHITMPLDRTIQYFGHIKTLIDSTTPTKVDDSLSYKTDMVKNYERSEIYNDQNNKQIGMIIEEQDSTNSRLNDTISTLDGTIQRVSKTETNISDIVTTTQVSTGKNHLYLEDACESNALNYRFDGATEQQTYTGKNLLNLTNGTYSQSGVTVVVNNGVITINGGNTSGSTAFIQIPLSTPITLVANQAYTLSINNNKTVGTNDNKVHFRVLNDGTFDCVSNILNSYATKTYTSDTSVTYMYLTVNNNVTGISNLIFQPQLEKSSTATDFEPYVGGTPSPNPNYPQYADTIPNVNLFNASKQEGVYGSTTYTVASDGLITQSATDSTAWSPTQAKNFTLNPGTYTISITGKNSSTYMQLRNITDSTDLVLSRSSQATFVITEQKQVGFKLYGGGSDAYPQSYYVMLEKGNVAHTYIPFGCYAKVRVTGENMCNHSLTVNLTSGSEKWSSVSLRDIYWENGKTYYIGAFFTKQSNETAQITNYSYTTIANKVATFTFNGTIPNVRVGANTLNGNIVNEDVKIMVSTEEFTEYVPYKENQVLIDMSKENLFTNNESNYYDSGTYWGGSISKIDDGVKVTVKTSGTYKYGAYLLDATDMLGKTYSISCKATPSASNNAMIRIYWFDTNNITTEIKSLTATGGTFTVPSTSQYNQIAILFYGNFNGTGNIDDYVNYTDIKLFESNNPTPYYELCKIGDYKDTLSIDGNGNCVINKNVGKVVLNGSESWTYQSDYSRVFTSINDNNNDLEARKKSICNYFTYGNTTAENNKFQIDGSHHILFRSSTTTSVNNWKTWLSTHNTDVYYPLATPETINLPNTKIPLFEGINHVTLIDDLETDTTISYYRKTPLSGTYATVTQLNNVSTEKTTEIQTVRKELLFEVSNERVRINAINETIDETGVPIVKTDTGYTFDIDGMKIEKGENDVSTIVDNDGLAVSYQNTEMLTVRSSGVEAENITTRKFYVQKPIRMEKTKSISDGSSIGLGFYYVGE